VNESKKLELTKGPADPIEQPSPRTKPLSVVEGGPMDPSQTDLTYEEIPVTTRSGRTAQKKPSPEKRATPSDVDLLNACREGDHDAWGLLVERYERLVFSVALRNGVAREEAADITQMTFMALLESIGTLREGERVASWLMSVARRLAWRQRRRSEREHLGVEEVDWPEDPIATWERLAVIHDGMQRLPPACRDLLRALFFDPAPQSYALIAERLGRPIGGIGPMRARCLRCLRAMLGEDAEL
jgi:RNA polymerase sigma factor (sigma-70 family)